MSGAERARVNAGLSIDQAAKHVRVCAKYLRQIESKGGASYVLATRLALLYRVPLDVFLYGSGETQKTKDLRRCPKQRRSANTR